MVIQMKQLKISEIMDNYTDNEFICDNEADIDADKVKSNVLKMTKRRTIRKPMKIFIAAAAAVFCLSAAAVAAGIPYRFGKIVTKSQITVTIDEKGNIDRSVYKGNPPFEYRDGRIIFTAVGEEKDITDLIDDETPYICSYISEDTGLKAYIAVGGNPGHTGFSEIINIGTAEEPYWVGSSLRAAVSEFIVYGVDLEFIGLTHEQEWELYQSDLTHHSSEGGMTEEVWKDSFVKYSSSLGGMSRVMPWAQRVVEELNLFEAKERMCAKYKFEISDSEFMNIVLGNITPYGGNHIPEGWDNIEDHRKWNPEMVETIIDKSPAQVRDGRLWLTVNGEEKDITDLIDENTSYTERVKDAYCETWVIVGGTPENYGCTQLVNLLNPADPKDWKNSFGTIDRSQNVLAFGYNPNGYKFTVDGEEITYEQLLEYLRQGVDLNGRFGYVDTTPEWFKEGCKKLMIEPQVRYVEN